MPRKSLSATPTAARACSASPWRSARSNIRRQSSRSRTSTSKAEPRGRRARAGRGPGDGRHPYARVTPEMYWNEPFAAPIPGAKDGRNFGHRRVFNGQPRAPHSGADLRATTGTPIYARIAAGWSCAKNLFYSGNAVFIDHGLGLHTHVSAFLRDQGEAGRHGRAWPADRPRGRERGASPNRTCTGASDRGRARRSVLLVEDCGGLKAAAMRRAKRALRLRQRQEIQELLRP